MKLLMDADCLIKLTKAGLKELVATRYSVSIPEPAKREVVDAGKKMLLQLTMQNYLTLKKH
jgi:hypothetical protein